MKRLLHCALLLSALAPRAAAQFGTALPVALDAWAAKPAPEAPLTMYMYDDGSTENALNMKNGGQIAWLQRFSAVGGMDIITSVSVVYGTAHAGGPHSPPAGSPTNVAVWDDTDDDGDPTTGLALVTVKATTIMTPDTDTFEKTAVTPAPVTNVFFIGAFTNNAVGQFPAGIDFNVAASAGRAWISGSNLVNGFVPGNINHPNHVGVFEMDNLGFPSVWLLRAEGIGKPSTFCTAKAGLFCGPPSISAAGIPSATAPNGFSVSASPARSCRQGVLIYNTSQVAGFPFPAGDTGTLCIEPMGIRRAAPIDSGGTVGPNCDGAFAIDMNAFRSFLHVSVGCAPLPGQTNPAGFLSTPGIDVFAAVWGRDTQATGSFVSNGVRWTIGP
jgi:hypothetical protein